VGGNNARHTVIRKSMLLTRCGRPASEDRSRCEIGALALAIIVAPGGNGAMPIQTEV
jgi:hypothetical protein